MMVVMGIARRSEGVVRTFLGWQCFFARLRPLGYAVAGFILTSFERSLVEAGRIELPSETQSRSASTCLFRTLNSPLQLLRTGSYNDYSAKFKIPTADE